MVARETFITSCTIDGLTFRLDYKRTSLRTAYEFSGTLYLKNPIAFTIKDLKFSPSLDVAHVIQEAILNSIVRNEAAKTKNQEGLDEDDI
jgi:hypothetical protein